MVLYIHMDNMIDEKKLNEAKKKLACKIKPAEYVSMSAAGGVSNACDSMPGSRQVQPDYIDQNGKVLLTRMTSAGG